MQSKANPLNKFKTEFLNRLKSSQQYYEQTKHSTQKISMRSFLELLTQKIILLYQIYSNKLHVSIETDIYVDQNQNCYSFYTEKPQQKIQNSTKNQLFQSKIIQIINISNDWYKKLKIKSNLSTQYAHLLKYIQNYRYEIQHMSQIQIFQDLINIKIIKQLSIRFKLNGYLILPDCYLTLVKQKDNRLDQLNIQLSNSLRKIPITYVQNQLQIYQRYLQQTYRYIATKFTKKIRLIKQTTFDQNSMTKKKYIKKLNKQSIVEYQFKQRQGQKDYFQKWKDLSQQVQYSDFINQYQLDNQLEDFDRQILLGFLHFLSIGFKISIKQPSLLIVTINLTYRIHISYYQFLQLKQYWNKILQIHRNTKTIDFKICQIQYIQKDYQVVLIDVFKCRLIEGQPFILSLFQRIDQLLIFTTVLQPILTLYAKISLLGMNVSKAEKQSITNQVEIKSMQNKFCQEIQQYRRRLSILIKQIDDQIETIID